jgi:hypothetical protein
VPRLGYYHDIFSERLRRITNISNQDSWLPGRSPNRVSPEHKSTPKFSVTICCVREFLIEVNICFAVSVIYMYLHKFSPRNTESRNSYLSQGRPKISL